MSSRKFGEFHSGIGRRQFIQRMGLLAGTAALPAPISWLSGCGKNNPTAPVQSLEIPFDPSIPWWLQDNFAPVTNEVVAENLEVKGSLPSELNGLYVRNGSNPQSGDSTHWFFGDGMLHGVHIENGKALWYRNKYVHTGLLGIDGTGIPPTGGNNASNVSAIYHGERLLTSGEIGLPFEIDPSDLSTRGLHTFDGTVDYSFTAHPKIDPATGYMHFFGYWIVEPYLTYYVADALGNVLESHEIPVDQPTMIHSFAITEQDIVFWECPVIFSLEAAGRGEANPFQWQPDYGARIGVMPIGGTPEQLRWVEIEPCYVFHEVNAYRDGDDILLDVCRHKDMFTDDRLTASGDSNRLTRWKINTAGETLLFSEETVALNQLELPTHDRRFTGQSYKHGWLVQTRYHPHTVDFGGIGHMNFQTGNLSIWEPGITRHATEAFFVPGGSGEGEGWLFTYVYDHISQKSVLAVLNAQDVQAGPLAEIPLPQRVPYGFHGVWVPSL